MVWMDRRISSKMFDLEMLESYKVLWMNRPALLCDLILYFLSHSSWLQLGIHLDIQVKLWQILWQFYQNIFLCPLACESCYSKSGYSFPDWSWVGIRDPQVKSRQSRLIRDAWTLCKGFWRVPGDASPEKIRNLRSSNCWKCTGIVNLAITVLFLYHFKYFTIPSGAPRAPPPPCLRAWYTCMIYATVMEWGCLCMEKTLNSVQIIWAF